MGLASAQQAFTRQTGQKPPLPDGWTEENDEVTKASFYSNEETGERSWVRPKHNGYMNFQDSGGDTINEYLDKIIDTNKVYEKLKSEYRKSFKDE